MTMSGLGTAVNMVMRTLSFIATLVLIGSVALPWLRLDGFDEPSLGLELIAMSVSPMGKYFFSVSPIQTGILVAGPALVLGLAFRVALKYAQRRRAMFTTAAILAASLVMTYGLTGVVAQPSCGPYLGLSLVMILSAVLLVHQALIKFATVLLRRNQWRPVYRTLRIVTGST